MGEVSNTHPRGWGFFNPLSRAPLNVKEFKRLPHLKEGDSKLVLLMSGIGLVVVVTQAILYLDPWAVSFWKRGVTDFYLPAVATLLLATFFIGLKQWSYYYSTDSSSPKGGIFKQSVKQVNQLEKTLDLLLAGAGAGLLVALCATPLLWFAGMVVYSMLVIARCFVTLERRNYFESLSKKGWHVPSWYVQSLDLDHRGMIVKYVLGGWIVTHLIVLAYSVFAELFLLTLFPMASPIPRILWLVTLVAVLLMLFFILSRQSYEWGKFVAKSRLFRPSADQLHQ